MRPPLLGLLCECACSRIQDTDSLQQAQHWADSQSKHGEQRKMETGCMYASWRSGGREDSAVTEKPGDWKWPGPKAANSLRCSAPSFQDKTHVHMQALNTKRALTCGFVALEVDDAHSLKARAALITSRIDQGEVSI